MEKTTKHRIICKIFNGVLDIDLQSKIEKMFSEIHGECFKKLKGRLHLSDEKDEWLEPDMHGVEFHNGLIHITCDHGEFMTHVNQTKIDMRETLESIGIKQFKFYEILSPYPNEVDL